mmetsp:Transcript_18619/g.24819  ORF Transcript_18619/g.24819 Transcript_18619/m.24819 type:complete len:126 (-) Transcript_18619:2046-2423(-)
MATTGESTAQVHPGNSTNPHPSNTSAMLLQLNLWNKVISHRRMQLQSLTLPQLRYLQQGLLREEESLENEMELRSSIETSLTGHFHKSVDSTLTHKDRAKGLEAIRLVFKRIDEVRGCAALVSAE